MPAEKPNAELEAMAFEIFKQAVANSPANRGGEQQAISAFKKAEMFLAVRDKVRNGELSTTKPTGPQLADCCCPNQHKLHPHNLVSQRFGDLNKVNRIAAFLARNPPSQDRPETDIAEAVNREFSDLSWKDSEVKIARAIFPAYCKTEAAKN